MRNKRRQFWIPFGLMLIAAALFLAGYNLWDSHRAGMAAEGAAQASQAQYAQGSKQGAADASLLNRDIPDPNRAMPVVTMEGIDYIGMLDVPSLGLHLPIISQWSYPNLKVAPCRYQGSAYSGNLVIAGHNYTSHFGALRQLQIGDVLTMTDVDGQTFTYEVGEMEVLAPGDVERMVHADWDLTLFTCTIGGQNRVTIRCEKKMI